MSEQYTPGPWAWRDFGSSAMLVTQHHGSRVVLSASPRGVLQTRDANGTLRPIETDHPNARLIAAAPDMYEALKWFIDDIDGTHTVMLDFDENVRKARAALNKARKQIASPVSVPSPSGEARDGGSR